MLWSYVRSAGDALESRSYVSTVVPEEWSRAFSAATSQEDATAQLAAHGWPIVWLSTAQVEMLISKSWWALALEVVRRAVQVPSLQVGGNKSAAWTAKLVDTAVRKAVGNVHLKADQLMSGLDLNYGRIDSIQPALQ